MPVLSLRLDPKLDRKLKHLSDDAERPKSYFVKKALELYLEEYEDYRLAMARRADQDDEVLSLGRMRKSLGL
ncbi:MAG: ribbon-helix-helix protein, CopG family [Nitrospirae bacterium]|nr:ribbon-helix-helix protein, CopG family [Nitrospirota bacterium]